MDSQALRMPYLLRVAMLLGALFGIVGTTAGLVLLVSAVSTEGPPEIVGDALSRAAFLAMAVSFLVFYIAACVTAGTASWALWKRRPQARMFLTVLLVEFVVGDTAVLIFARRFAEVPAAELGISAGVFVVLVALALWYLYGKHSVVEYFESQRLASAAPSAS
jgi:hypothetical protein